MKIAKSRRGFPIYKANPFVHRITVETRPKQIIVAKGDVQITETTTGEFVAPATIGAYIQVEKTEFLKVFTSEMQHYFDLSRVGTRMLGVMFRACQREVNKAEVFLSYNRAQEIYKENFSKNIEKDILTVASYHRGIKELLEKEFIAEHPDGTGWFFTNPAIFFNGNRVRFVKEYVQTEEFKELQKQFSALEQYKLPVA